MFARGFSLVLASALVLAQSNPATPIGQSSWLPSAQEHSRTHLSLAPKSPEPAVGKLGARATAPASALPGLNFAPTVSYNSGGLINANQTTSVVIADVNGDGKPDIIVPNYGSNTVGVLLGNGDGTFQAAATYTTGGREATSVAVGDINGDGKPDIVVTNGGSDDVGVLLGNGDGTFQTAVTYPSGGYVATSVTIGDLNGDGKPDLVVASCSAGGACGGGFGGLVGVLLGNGDGTFQAPVSYNSGGNLPTRLRSEIQMEMASQI